MFENLPRPEDVTEDNVAEVIDQIFTELHEKQKQLAAKMKQAEECHHRAFNELNNLRVMVGLEPHPELISLDEIQEEINAIKLVALMAGAL